LSRLLLRSSAFASKTLEWKVAVFTLVTVTFFSCGDGFRAR
jgi:hypothetical protein